MQITAIVRQLKSRKTWNRVFELVRWGSYKNKEKRILYGAPVSHEDKLPLKITIILTMTTVALVLVLSWSLTLGLFPRIVNILLAILFVVVICLPRIMLFLLKE